MRPGFNRLISDIEYERNHHPAPAMVPTTPAEMPTPHRTPEQKAHRRFLQFQLRLLRSQQATAGEVDSLTAWKARFADYLLRPKAAAEAPTAPVSDTDLMRAAVYGKPGDYERLLNGK